MNLFDDLQKTAMGVVNNTMGYNAVWGYYSAIVLLNKPTQKDDVSDEAYQTLSPKVEIFDTDFPGLFESVQAGNNERIEVNGIAYNCYHAEKKFDGKTIIINLDLAS